MAKTKTLPSLSLLCLADFALTSGDGKLSIIGIFDRIFATTTPVAYSRFFIVATIADGQVGEQSQIELAISGPQTESILPPKQISIKFGSEGKANILTDVVNLHLPEIGTYTITVKLDGHLLGSTPLSIVKINPPQLQPDKVN